MDPAAARPLSAGHGRRRARCAALRPAGQAAFVGSEGLKVEATDVQLAWQPLALLSGMVQLDHVRAAALRIEDRRPPKPKVVPASLVIPLRVKVDEAKVGQVQWVAAANSFEASELAGSYSFDGSQHQVKLDSLRWATGRYSGQASVGAQGTLPVDAALAGRIETPVPGSTHKAPAGLLGDAAWSDDRSSSSCLARGTNGFAQRHRPCDSDCARDALGGAARAAGAGRVSTAGPGRVVAAGAAHQPGRAGSVAAGGDGDLGADHRTHERAARPLGQAAASGGTAARKRRMATVGAGTGAQPGSAGGWRKHPGQRPVARRRRLDDGKQARRRQPRRGAQHDGAAGGGWACRPEGRRQCRGVRRGPQGRRALRQARRPAASSELAAAVQRARAARGPGPRALGRWPVVACRARGPHGRRAAARFGRVAARCARRQRPRRSASTGAAGERARQAGGTQRRRNHCRIGREPGAGAALAGAFAGCARRVARDARLRAAPRRSWRGRAGGAIPPCKPAWPCRCWSCAPARPHLGACGMPPPRSTAA